MRFVGAHLGPLRQAAADLSQAALSRLSGDRGREVARQLSRIESSLDALEAKPRAIDIGTHVPHAPIRAYVLGDRCNTDYEPNAEEIAEMAALVREGVEAGALGFSTSRTIHLVALVSML